jgi:hypothetical protein
MAAPGPGACGGGARDTDGAEASDADDDGPAQRCAEGLRKRLKRILSGGGGIESWRKASPTSIVFQMGRARLMTRGTTLKSTTLARP